MLASTRSLASFSISSLAPYSGERGRAMRPVRADSRMPNGEMSFMNESILVGFADLDRQMISPGKALKKKNFRKGWKAAE